MKNDAKFGNGNGNAEKTNDQQLFQLYLSKKYIYDIRKEFDDLTNEVRIFYFDKKSWVGMALYLFYKNKAV